MRIAVLLGQTQLHFSEQVTKMNVRTTSPFRGLANWAFAAFFALAAGTANAAVLASQAPSGSTGVLSDITTGQWVADDFQLPGAVTLNKITWWGFDAVPGEAPTDVFTVRLFKDDLAGTPIGGGWSVMATGQADGSYRKYEFDLINDLGQAASLDAGSYFLSIVGETDPSQSWAWQVSDYVGPMQYSLDDGASWGPDNYNLAWQLEGDRAQIPEPSSVALLGIAGLAMLLAGRRRRPRGA